MRYVEKIASNIFAEVGKQNSSKIQLLRCGEWQHPKYGALRITPITLNNLKANFEKGIRGVDLAIDTEHKPEEGANAWVKKLSIEKGGKELWAEVDWTDLGKKNIGGNIYKYTSAEFVPEYKDTETGKVYKDVMMGAALTNRPFIKHMDPVLLSENVAKEIKLKDNKEVFRMNQDEVTKLKAIRTDAKLLAETIAEANEVNRATLLNDLHSFYNGIDEITSGQEKEQAFLLTEDAISNNPEVVALKEKVMESERIMLREQRERTVRLAEDITNSFICDPSSLRGKILPKSKETLIRLLSELDEDHANMVKKFVDELPAVIDYSEHGVEYGEEEEVVKNTEEVDQKVLLKEIDSLVNQGMSLRDATKQINQKHNVK